MPRLIRPASQTFPFVDIFAARNIVFNVKNSDEGTISYDAQIVLRALSSLAKAASLEVTELPVLMHFTVVQRKTYANKGCRVTINYDKIDEKDGKREQAKNLISKHVALWVMCMKPNN